MFGIRKKIFGLIGSVLFLAIAAVVFAFIHADSLAEAALEKGASDALKVETLVDAVKLSPFRGKVAVRELSVANPERFVSEKLFTCGLMRVEADVWSFLGDEARVREIVIESPKLTIEPGGGSTNVTEVLKNLSAGGKKEAPATEPAGAPEPEKAESSGGKEMAFRVGRIAVTGAVARFQVGPLGKDVELPDIEIKDISNADGTPVMLRDIIRQVLARMAAESAKAGKGAAPEEAVAALASGLKGQADEKVRGILDEVRGRTEGVRERVDEARDRVRSLLPFGRRDEEKEE